MNAIRELNNALAAEKKLPRRERQKSWTVGAKRYTDCEIKALATALLGHRPMDGWDSAWQAASYLAANHYEVHERVKP